jgi:metallo-beta-lactamase family protein
LPDARHTVVFVGFQAEGTRGRALVQGAKAVKIHGAMVPVGARVEAINSMSAHADSDEILRWARTFETPPRQVYLVHGEPAVQDVLKARLVSELGWAVHAPQHGETIDLPL